MTLHEQLARIRQMQGLPPLDGTVIPESGQEPWPQPMPENPDEFDMLPDNEPEPAPEPPAPTIYRAQAPEPVQTSEPVMEASELIRDMADLLSQKELVIHDSSAMYRGTPTQLNAQEKARVAAIVLGAMRRTLDEHYAQLGLTRKRRRKAVESADRKDAGVAHALPAPPPTQKKRGRPRKVRQHLDGSESPA